MELAKELVRQQVFFRRELSERVGWFIGLRWVAIAVALAGMWIAHALRLELRLKSIAGIIAAIVVYNILFTIACRYLRRFSPDREKPFEICAHGQIVCDLSALFGLIFYTGGFYSPLVLFIIFHIILAGILLNPIHAYIYSGLMIIGLGLLGYLQHADLIQPPIPLFSHTMFNSGHSLGEGVFLFLILAAAVLVTAFLVTSIKRSLRIKGRNLLVFCKELDVANAKLTALYDFVKHMALCTEYQALMDSATRNTARIMGVKACSIKLLDDQANALRFASTYGLSQNYLARGNIDIDKSPINQKIIAGAVYSIGKIEERDYFQYPENILKEGISSMLCLPLRVEKRVLGVFCVYSEASFSFSKRDVDFFTLVADLTALAMQNLKSELNKSWFLQKAAHQLRSPLNAVDTILKVLRKAYAGPLNERQGEMLLQCERRIESLSAMLHDLLKLGIKRAGSTAMALLPIDLGPLLAQLAAVFKAEAEEKQIAMILSIDPGLPLALGEERLLDDICSNLLSNAVKYTPPGGSVRVTLHSEDEERLCLQVIDTGIGIPQEQISLLFNEFFRAENAKALTDQGTGLGLVIVKEAINRLRGTIMIESRENEGTRVICRFPTVHSMTTPACPAPAAFITDL
ncbi:MAG: GAF domain-containing protein [Desulfobacteraceae bacterium]|nr:MAG: GAF domain-containing protein [Desulfobacteraceae bacterium]